LSKSQKDLLAWKLNWVLGREFYRARQDAFSLAYWDGIAWGNYPNNPDFTDNQPALSDYRKQVKPGFLANTPGWNNNTCSLDLPSLACFAFWLAATSDAVRVTAVALMMQNDADIPYLKEYCPAEVTADPAYQIEVPPIPGGAPPVEPTPACKPAGAACSAGEECCENLICDQGKCGYAKGVELDKLPPIEPCPAGTVRDAVSGLCVKTSALDPVKADDTTAAGDKTNWWLWGTLATLVVGGAAFIGLVRQPEVVYDQPEPNPGPAGSPFGGPYKVEIKLYSRQRWEHFASNLSSIKKVNDVLKNMRKEAKRVSEMYAYPKDLASELRAVADGLAEVRVLDRLNSEVWSFDQVPVGNSKGKKS
jgi:hypothetical protein